MAAEIKLSDGTKIKSEENANSDDVLRTLQGPSARGFVAIRDEHMATLIASGPSRSSMCATCGSFASRFTSPSY